MQRLVIFDYFIVHSDDLPDGPPGLHPQTPYRSGELLVRRGILQDSILLYASRGLIDRRYSSEGVYFAASETAAAFLDALTSRYVRLLRDRADWLVASLGDRSDADIEQIANRNLGKWGAEFVMQSVLWEEPSEP